MITDAYFESFLKDINIIGIKLNHYIKSIGSKTNDTESH
jgi:hypothetical protein